MTLRLLDIELGDEKAKSLGREAVEMLIGMAIFAVIGFCAWYVMQP